ncbi:putative carboxylesterase [Abeliophyllum distichum]|uniref:Carboxylesterase n=1 Tax=Abeliophyllum distichum TaxID=126358 RepID=A0ABD1PCE3_9LAMI
MLVVDWSLSKATSTAAKISSHRHDDSQRSSFGAAAILYKHLLLLPRSDFYWAFANVETLLKSGGNNVKILSGFLSHPYFWGSKPIELETNEETEQNVAYKIWLFVYPSVPGGIDNPMNNPFVDDTSSLSGLACSRLLVCLAEKDPLTSRKILYVESVKKNGWNGDVELVDVEGEDHCFHFFDPDLP